MVYKFLAKVTNPLTPQEQIKGLVINTFIEKKNYYLFQKQRLKKIVLM
jgi:hypothetical protein